MEPFFKLSIFVNRMDSMEIWFFNYSETKGTFHFFLSQPFQGDFSPLAPTCAAYVTNTDEFKVVANGALILNALLETNLIANSPSQLLMQESQVAITFF